MSPIHSSSSSSSGCLSLRLTMGALNAFVVAVVTSITLAITLTLSLQALRSIGATQVASVAQSTSYRIGDYFNRPVTLANGINNYSRTRIWPTNMSLVDYNGTWSRWTDVIMNVYFANKNVGEVQFIFADGSRIGFLSSTNYNGLFIKQSLVLAPNGSLLMDYLWYNASTLAVLPKTCPPYRNDFTPPADPREGILPILTSGTVNGRISPWLQPTILVLAGGSVGYYASYISAAHDANGTVLAYGVYTLRIENVNEYLAEIKSTPNTHAFVVDPDGYLFASNYPAPIAVLTFNVSSNNTLGKGCSSALTTLSAQSTAVKRTVSCRASMFDYPYKPLNALSQPTVTTDAASPEVSLISVDQENYYTVAKHIVFDGVGPPLFMILIMPESDVIGNVVTGRNVAIGVCAGVFILVAVAVFAIITRLLSPLSQISARMMRASALEDDDDDADLSSFAEVRELQEAYLGMNSELRRIRSFVPQSLLMSRVSASANRNSIVEVNNIDDLGVDTEAVAAPPPSPPGAEHRPPVNVSSAGNSAKANSVVDTSQQASVASSLRRRRASRQRKVTFDPSVMSQLQASIGIRIEHVSVLAADLGDFHNTCRLLQPQEIELRMQGTVDFVYSLVTHHSGVLERFNGDHFMATFNGAKRCGEHTIRAVSAALQLSTHVQPDAFQLTWRIGVASGRSFVGNLGSDQVRAFNVVGSAMTHATALQRIAKMYRRKTVLIPQRVFSEVSTQHDVRPLDIVCLPGGGKPVVIGEVSFRPESRTEAPEQDANGFTDKRPTAAATSTPPLARSAPNADWLYQADQSASPNRLPLLLKFFACVSDQRSGAAKRYLELLGLSFGEDGQTLAPSPFTDRDNSSDYTPQKEAAALPPIDDAPAVLERSTSFHVPNHAQLLRWEVLEFLRYSDVLPPRTTPPTSDTDGDEGEESVDTLPSDFRRPQPRLPSSASRQELESWYLYTPTSIILQFLASKMPRVPLLHGLLEEAIADKVGQHMGPFYDWVVASAPFHHSNS